MWTSGGLLVVSDTITSNVRRNRDYCVGQVFLLVAQLPPMNNSCQPSYGPYKIVVILQLFVHDRLCTCQLHAPLPVAWGWVGKMQGFGLLLVLQLPPQGGAVDDAIYPAGEMKRHPLVGVVDQTPWSIRVEACISEVQETLYSAVSELASIQDQALLDCYCGGVSPEDISQLSESSNEPDSEEDSPVSPKSDNITLPDDQNLLYPLQESEFN